MPIVLSRQLDSCGFPKIPIESIRLLHHATQPDLVTSHSQSSADIKRTKLCVRDTVPLDPSYIPKHLLPPNSQFYWRQLSDFSNCHWKLFFWDQPWLCMPSTTISHSQTLVRGVIQFATTSLIKKGHMVTMVTRPTNDREVPKDSKEFETMHVLPKKQEPLCRVVQLWERQTLCLPFILDSLHTFLTSLDHCGFLYPCKTQILSSKQVYDDITRKVDLCYSLTCHKLAFVFLPRQAERKSMSEFQISWWEAIFHFLVKLQE